MNQGGAKILIVDDERGPRESMRMILEPKHRVVQAASGAEALKCLRGERFDLMTLDLNMPGMHGQELMRTVQAEFPQVEIVIITGCGTVESAAESIRSGVCDYLQKPFDVVQVNAAVERALSRHSARTRLQSFLAALGDVTDPGRDALAIVDDMQRSEKMRDRVSELFERASQSQDSTGSVPDPAATMEFLEVLTETIEVRDRCMCGHARRVAFYASLLADRLDLDPTEREHIRFSAFLHDLGKVGVPTNLLLRDGPLDAAERALVEQHPVIGGRLIEPLMLPAAISSAIHHHHEWWDGSGYPDGQSGEQIPLAARIISVVDAFDAMSSDRPYRKALSRDVACEELRRFSGIQFDPELTKQFLFVLESGAWDIDLELVADAVANSLQTNHATDQRESIE